MGISCLIVLHIVIALAIGATLLLFLVMVLGNALLGDLIVAIALAVKELKA
jgi:hypothetical protein